MHVYMERRIVRQTATAWLDQARCQQIMEANPDQIKVNLEQLLSLSSVPPLAMLSGI
jgi:hypothetical protein